MRLNVITAFLITFASVDIHDPAVHGVFAELLRNARFGCASTEEAGFLIRDQKGATFFQRWRPQTRFANHFAAYRTAGLPAG